MKTLIVLFLLSAPAFGQSMYKCPATTEGAPAVYQQMPCSLQGGGEVLPVKALTSGKGAGLSDSAKAYLADVDSQRAAQAAVQAEEDRRQEALSVERSKAAAQRDTARAIDRQTAVMAAPRVITIHRRRY